MATDPQHSETMSGAPASSEPVDVGANASLIVAALGRIEDVVRDQRTALASLRAALGEMAQAIARAKAVADSENAAAMLDEFEHRVDAMIETAGGARDTEQAAESDQVPTVSDVVLRLGPGDAAPEPAVAETAPPAESAGERGPTVAMLAAMVEALSASIQTPAPEPPAEPESQAEPEPRAEPKPVVEAPPNSLPGETLAQESTLLASFEQMEIRPFPPPEEGMAVIFTSQVSTSEIEPEPAATAAPQEPVASAPATTQFEPATAPEPPLHAELAPAADAVASEAEAAPPAGPATESKPADAAFDPADFLFGPEPELEPAAFLLDPPPPPRPPAGVIFTAPVPFSGSA